MKSGSHAFAERYLAELKGVLDALPVERVGAALDLLHATHTAGKQVFLAGNGGSAATASHMANDLSWGLTRARLRPMRAVALTDNVPVMTAIANDAGYEEMFAAQLDALGAAGDLLIAISASGNSPNVVKVLERAARIGLRSIGFLGMGGGKAASMVDVAVVVPASDYGPIEDVHMVLDHLALAYLRLALRG
jgi:D-sedoheptulose 7-phosphate isomerase